MTWSTGCVEVVRQLLDRGLDEQHRDNSGWTPLHYAAFEGKLCTDLVIVDSKITGFTQFVLKTSDYS